MNAGAEVAFRRAREIDTAAADANVGLAAFLEGTGRRTEAIEILDRLAKARPRELGIQIPLGQVLIRAGELDGAEAVFRRVIEIDGASVESRRTLADVLDAQGRSSEAADIMRRLTAERNGDAELQARLGQLLIRSDDLAAAEAAYRRAIELEPASVETRRSLADVLDAQGRSREGAEILQLLAAEQPDDARLHGRLGQLLIRGGDLAGAEAALLRAVELDPAPADPWHDLVNVLTARGRRDQAITIVQRLVAAASDDDRTHARLREILRQQGGPGDAGGSLCAATALEPGNAVWASGLAAIGGSQGAQDAPSRPAAPAGTVIRPGRPCLGRAPTPKSPLVSIVCLTYNHETFIAEAISGMLGQTYAPLDIIILDDASTDATAQVVRDELAKYPQRRDIRFIRNDRNLGIRDNFEKGVSLARGRFISKAHGDDIMMPTMIEEMARVWGKEDVSLVATNARYIDERSNELGRFFRDPAGPHDDSFETLVRDGANVVCFGATQGFDRRLYEEFGWPPEYLTSDDIMLAFYAYLAKGARFIPEPLLKYRVHGHNASLGLEAERSNGKERLLVEAEIYYVMLAHSFLMRSEIERLSLADPALYGEICRRIEPQLQLQTSEMAKKLVNTRIGLRHFGVSRLTAATGSNGH